MTEAVSSNGEDFLERVPWWVSPGILVGIPILAGILSLLSETFYRNVVWKYFWGPIKADGSESHTLIVDGVTTTAGYNLWNTLALVVILAACVLGIGQLLNRYKVVMDNKMILGAVTWLVAGSIFHVLQDSQLFAQPFEFVFITPPVWLLFAAFGVGSAMLGVYFRHIQDQTGSLERAMQKVWFLFVIVILIYTAVWLRQWDQIVSYVNPIWVAAYTVVTFGVFRLVTERLGRIEPWVALMTFSIGWILTSLHWVFAYLENPWPGKLPDDELQYAIWVAPLLALAVAGVVYLVARLLLNKGKENAAPYLLPINLVLIFSQMLDAFATAIGIDLSTYTEKHILSEGVRKGFQNLAESVGWTFGAAHPTFLGFASLKLLVSLAVVYVIDIQSKEDLEKRPTLINLIKMAIIMVGLGPGIRNMLRMTLGI